MQLVCTIPIALWICSLLPLCSQMPCSINWVLWSPLFKCFLAIKKDEFQTYVILCRKMNYITASVQVSSKRVKKFSYTSSMVNNRLHQLQLLFPLSGDILFWHTGDNELKTERLYKDGKIWTFNLWNLWPGINIWVHETQIKSWYLGNLRSWTNPLFNNTQVKSHWIVTSFCLLVFYCSKLITHNCIQFHHHSLTLTFILGFCISCITEAVPYLRESFLQWFIQNMCQINHHGTRHCWISGTNKVILPVVLGVIMTCQNKIAPCIRV